MALTEHELAAAVGLGRATPGARITTYNGISVDLRIVAPDAYGNLLQHFTGSAAAQRRAARAGGEDGALGLRARDRRDRVGRRSSATRPRPRSTSASGSPTSSPSCARAAARSPPPPRASCPELVERRRHPRRPALPHDALGRAQHARGDGRGGAGARLRLPGDHRPLRQPRVRQRRHRGRAAASGSRRSPRYNAGRHGRASGCSPAPRSTSSPTARSTTSPRCSSSSTG